MVDPCSAQYEDGGKDKFWHKVGRGGLGRRGVENCRARVVIIVALDAKGCGVEVRHALVGVAEPQLYGGGDLAVCAEGESPC